MSKGVHNIAFYVSPDPECSRTTQNSEISIAPSRGRILYAIYGNRTCVISHIVITAIDKKYRNYYVSTIGNDNLWTHVRDSLAAKKYHTLLQGKGAAKIKPFNCAICHSVDHP